MNWILVRYGAPGHCIQIFYSTLVQVFNCVDLLVGGLLCLCDEFTDGDLYLQSGSAVFESITGMNAIAGCFLLPIGVVIYTLTGGSKCTI